MIIFIYGDNSQKIRESKSRIILEYQKKHSSGMNLINLRLSDFNALNSLEDALKTISFFDEIKLVSVADAFISDKLSSQFLSTLLNFDALNNREVVVMVVENQGEKELAKINKDLFDYLSKGKPVIECRDRAGKDLMDWVVAEASRLGSSITLSNAAYLIMKAGPSLSNDISKLTSFRLGKEISKEDIDLLVKTQAESNIFEMVDACASEKRVLAASLLRKEIDLGASPHYILSMLAFQYRNLIFAKGVVSGKEFSQDLMRRAGIKPFTLNKSKGLVRHKSEQSLLGAHRRLMEIDVQSKNGLIDVEDALYDFVLKY